MTLARTPLLGILALVLSFGCQSPSPSSDDASPDSASTDPEPKSYATVRLDEDVSDLSKNKTEIVSLLIDAAQTMDGIFWEQAYGNRDSLLHAVSDPTQHRLVEINYGPWDRLNENEPFIDGAGPKPPGANFYPPGVTRTEIERDGDPDAPLDGRYTMVRRLPDGTLTALPYHTFFAEPMLTAADGLNEAASLAENESLRQYLERRAEALETGEYAASERAWMDVRRNELDILIGPISTEEDQLLGVKAAAEAVVLRRNPEWSTRLDRYLDLLPDLRADLPGLAAVEQDTGPDPIVDVYDVLYAAGFANAGPKTTSYSLPTEQRSSPAQRGRRALFRNVTRGTFDQILRPLADVLIAESQPDSIPFEAAFNNALFREVGRRLVPAHPRSRGDTGAESDPDARTIVAESTVDVLGLAVAHTMVPAVDELDGDLGAHDAAFLAHLVHSLRSDSAGTTGRADLVQFNYLRDAGGFSRDSELGTYAIHTDSMAQAADALARDLASLHRDDDPEAMTAFITQYGTMSDSLRADLDRLADEGIPRAIAYEQGPSVLQGLEPATAAE